MDGLDPITVLSPHVLQSLADQPLTPEELEGRKERSVVQSNRVKLTEYIHDVTLLFPHMKEKAVFSTDDCDIINGERTNRLKVDKFVDILLTKGPRAIGVFHVALDAVYPSVFDFLAQLFTSAGVQLSERRQPKDRDLEVDDETSEHKPKKLGSSTSRTTIFRHGSRTIRRTLDILGRQCEVVQKDRDELQKALVGREKEIAALLSSREAFHNDLVSVTTKYQQLLSELIDWRNLLSNQSEGTTKKLKELMSQREAIQCEHDQLESEYMLVCSELSAARDRISTLLSHLERSETVVTIKQEEMDKLKDKVERYEGQNQRLHRKIKRLQHERGEEAILSGETVPMWEKNLEEKCKQLQEDLDRVEEERSDLQAQLQVVRTERKQAIQEKEDIVYKYYLEKKKRRMQKQEFLRQLDSQSVTSVAISPLPFDPPRPSSCKAEDVTVVMASPNFTGPGMTLELAVLVVELVDRGIAANNGVQVGDRITEVNHITLAHNKDPLEFANQLLSAAAKSVTLTISRQVPKFEFPRTPSFPKSFPYTTPTSLVAVNPLEVEILKPRKRSANLELSLGAARQLKAQQSGFSSASTASNSGAEKSHSHDDQTTPSSDGHPASQASVSEDSDSDSGSPRGLPILNRISQTSVNSGLIQSPPACGYHHHQFDRDLPGTITVWGTITGTSEPEQGVRVRKPRRATPSENLIDRFGDAPDNFSSPNYAGDDPERSIASSLELEGLGQALHLGTPPQQRNRKGRCNALYRKDKEKRKSWSLEDINMFDLDINAELVISPQVQRKNVASGCRRVLLPGGLLGMGLYLMGGRGRGVFIHSTRRVNSGLRSGDQITMIGPNPVEGLSYAEVVEMFNSYASKDEQCIITVVANVKEYEQMSVNDRDDFYVRAKYSHQSSKKSELSYEKGVVFHVLDTLPRQYPGLWKVEKVGSKGVEERGFIQTSLSVAETMESGVSSSLPHQFFRNFSPKQLRRKEVGRTMSTNLEETKVDLGKIYQLYEPVRRMQVTEPRPVVLVGSLEVEIRSYLVKHGSTSDIKFCYCKREPAEDLAGLDENEVIESIVVYGQEMRSTAQHVHEQAQQGYHCVLCISPADLLKPSVVKLCPIVLLLEATSTRAVRKLRESIDLVPSQCDNDGLHVERAKEAKKFGRHITGEIDLGGQFVSYTMCQVAEIIRETVSRQQMTVIWESEQI